MYTARYTEQVNVLLEKETKDLITDVVKSTPVSQAEVIRRALAVGLAPAIEAIRAEHPVKRTRGSRPRSQSRKGPTARVTEPATA